MNVHWHFKRKNTLVPLQIIFLAALIFLRCVERDERNPFDPGHPPLVELKLTPASDQVTLNWHLMQAISDFRGFRIYRAVDSLQTLQAVVDVSTNQFSYTDTTVEKGKWYFYSVSVLGMNVESSLSKVRKTYPGEGIYWVLSKFDARVYQFSYDLIHRLKDYSTVYRPTDWAVSAQSPDIWINFSDFNKGIVQLNKDTGEITSSVLSSLAFPIDIDFAPSDNTIYILDNESSKIFAFRNGNISNEVALGDSSNFYKIRLDEINDQLFVLGSKKLVVLSTNLTPQSMKTVEFPGGYETKDFDLVGTKGYVLTASETAQSSIIYTINLNALPEDTLTISGRYYRIRYDWVNNWFYLAEEISGDDSIVQLSPSGSRQLAIPGFKSIEQIEINPFDRTVLIVDYGKDLISLYDKHGAFISESRNEDGQIYLVTPFRLFVE